MTDLEKLRLLIWDKEEDVFTDDELEEFLEDCNGDIYRTAAFCLNIVRANPEKFTSYSLGAMSFTFQDLDKAIKKYENMAGSNFGTTETVRVY